MKIMDCMRARVVRVPLYPILRTWRTYSMPAKTHGHCFWLPLNQVRYVSESVLVLHLLKSAEAYLICRVPTVSCGPSGTLGRRQHRTDESLFAPAKLSRTSPCHHYWPCVPTVLQELSFDRLVATNLPSLVSLCPWAATVSTISTTADFAAIRDPEPRVGHGWNDLSGGNHVPGITAIELLRGCDGLHHVPVLAPRLLNYLKLSRIRRAHCVYTSTTGEVMNHWFKIGYCTYFHTG